MSKLHEVQDAAEILPVGDSAKGEPADAEAAPWHKTQPLFGTKYHSSLGGQDGHQYRAEPQASAGHQHLEEAQAAVGHQHHAEAQAAAGHPAADTIQPAALQVQVCTVGKIDAPPHLPVEISSEATRPQAALAEGGKHGAEARAATAS